MGKETGKNGHVEDNKYEEQKKTVHPSYKDDVYKWINRVKKQLEIQRERISFEIGRLEALLDVYNETLNLDGEELYPKEKFQAEMNRQGILLSIDELTKEIEDIKRELLWITTKKFGEIRAFNGAEKKAKQQGIFMEGGSSLH